MARRDFAPVLFPHITLLRTRYDRPAFLARWVRCHPFIARMERIREAFDSECMNTLYRYTINVRCDKLFF